MLSRAASSRSGSPATGFDAVLDILKGYRDAQKPEVIFKRVLGYEVWRTRFGSDLSERRRRP